MPVVRVQSAAIAATANSGRMVSMDRNSTTRFDAGKLLRTLGRLCILTAVIVVVVFATEGYNFGHRYYWGMILASAPIAAYLILRRRTRAFELRRMVERRWAQPRPSDAQHSHAECRAYFWALAPAPDATLDDHTWTDLGMDSVMDEIDRCYSAAGRNELYALLRTCLPREDEAQRRKRLTERIRTDGPFRLDLLAQLAVLDNANDRDPAPLLLSRDRLPVDPLFPLYVTMSAAVVLSLMTPFLLGVGTGVLLVIAVFLTNMWIYYRTSRRITELVPMFRALFRLIKQAHRIAGLDLAEAGLDEGALQDHLRKTAKLGSAFRTIVSASAAGTAGASADFVESLTMLLRILFLTDLIAYNRIAAGIRRSFDSVRAIYRTIGWIDAVQAIASYLERSGAESRITMVDSIVIEAEGLYHPVLERPVANSIELAMPGAVVTGTNMAGKSTFLRTLGINAILAQTIGACFATSYRAGRFLVMSSIEKSDSLESGKSFYYAEAERIFRMMERLGGEVPVLLLIDELLSGTNSLERESASVAILEYLAGRKALTVAATHDVTIAERTSDRYRLYYFTDRADATGLTFDYRIRPGIVASRNAIRLLELIGYPRDIIERALEGARKPDDAPAKGPASG